MTTAPHRTLRTRPARRRHPAVHLLAGLALLACSCSPATDLDAPADGQPPAANSARPASTTSPLHTAADTVGQFTGDADLADSLADLHEPRPSREPDSPEHAAAGIILAGLAAEGLLVTDLDTDLTHSSPGHATVVVTVAHSPGQGHPTQSRYELDLVRTSDGWTLTHHREQR